jgi:hypothetical protein
LKIQDYEWFPNPVRIRITSAEEGLYERVLFVNSTYLPGSTSPDRSYDLLTSWQLLPPDRVRIHTGGIAMTFLPYDWRLTDVQR